MLSLNALKFRHNKIIFSNQVFGSSLPLFCTFHKFICQYLCSSDNDVISGLSFYPKALPRPLSTTLFSSLSIRGYRMNISAFWGLREMCKCFLKATVNAGNYSQSSGGLGGEFIETSRLGGTEGGSQHNPKDAQEVVRLCRNSRGDQKMLQTECFSHPARWI